MVTLSSRDADSAPTAANDVIHTDLLIVGAGPAGASLACFLAAHGRKGLLIASAPGTASTPRAHITNMAGLECLRDIGLEEACLAVATPSHNMAHTRWCHSMAGDEFARVYSWGHHPLHKGAYETASPCRHVDLPQTLLEPILVRRAVEGGWSVRFGTEWCGMERTAEDVIVSEVLDRVTGRRFKVQSRFVFGCDGARSRVVKELGLPLDKKPGQGLALNVLVRADLSRYMETRVGNLHWVVRPDEESCPPWGWAVVVRMVKAWNEWMFIFLPAPWANIQSPEQMDASDDEYVARVKEMIGDDKIKVELLHVGKWWINETVAEKYSDGNVFCFGDATHRHPPFNGLGSNTCIQDAFNLAWKVDYVMAGKAGPKLLDSFSVERQPVGADVITRANQGMRDHGPWQQLIGMHEQDWEKRKAMFAELDDPGEKGRLKRQEFQKAIENTETEFHGLGIEMNQRYVSDAVYLADQGAAPAVLEGEAGIKTHVVTTYPGRRLPHVWLNARTPEKPVSTIDLAGHGRFCLLTGPGGQAWKDAAKTVSQSLGIGIVSYSIGWKQDYEDVYFDWARKREVDEDGCVLVRPDRFVAWRSTTLVQEPTAKLAEVMRSVLSL